MQHGTAAHGTRLQRDIKRAAIQAVIAQSLSRVAQGLDFGVRGRIVVANGGIAPNTNDLPCLDNHCAHWHLTGQGPEPGSFSKALVLAVQRADIMNRARLATQYPGLVAAYEMAVGSATGLDTLVVIAKGVAS